MRGLGRVAMVGAVLAAIVATVFNCGGHTGVRRSLATTHNAETEPATPHTPIKYVAIVEAEVDAESDASASLNKAEVRQITAVLRKEAVKNLPQKKYNIMTTETVMSQGSAVLEECSDENCVIKVGAAIGADYIVRGTISKFGNMLTVSVDMYETNDGNLVASSELVRSENIVELLDKTAGASAEMYRLFENPKYTATKQTSSAQQNTVADQQTIYQTPAPTPAPAPNPTPINQPSGVKRPSTFTDGRDGKKYRTVVIGGMRWMAENLNYQPQFGNSWCYNNDNSYCNKYGRLYDWNTAMTVCPSGYHLPSHQEWDNLVMASGNIMAGKMLKAKSGWNGSAKGTDDYGFSALPGGYRNYNFSNFYVAGSYGYWWTATVGESGAYRRYIDHVSDHVHENVDVNSFGYSVRCVADN